MNEYTLPADNKLAAKKILLVEDNQMNSDMLSRRLERKGYTVILAVDGLEALEKSRSENPDLILMDLSLPNMDGWEATTKLKGDENTKNIPLIVITAHALKADREKAFEIGCDDFDVKPIDFKRLLSKIDAQLGK